MPRPMRMPIAAAALAGLVALIQPSAPLAQTSPPAPRPDRSATDALPGTGDYAGESGTGDDAGKPITGDDAGRPATGPAASAGPMTLARLEEILRAVDPALETSGAMFRLKVGEVQAIIVTDARADRMRILVPVRPAEGLTVADLERMMQANFDSALDARYAIARGTLWSAFIHPLSPLGKDELLSGLGQTANLAASYGGLYASGGLVFQGGDSAPMHKQLIEDLLKKGEDL